jgi:Ferrochelatase
LLNLSFVNPDPERTFLFFNGRVSQRDHVALFIVRSFRQQRVPVHNREIAAHGFFLLTHFLRIRPPETLEEIAIRYASLYRSHGGGELRYIPALNDSPGHIKALASLLRRQRRAGRPVRVSLEDGCGLLDEGLQSYVISSVDSAIDCGGRLKNTPLRVRSTAVIGVFFAVDRRNMRRIFIEIRSPDPNLFAVRIDPLPQVFT